MAKVDDLFRKEIEPKLLPKSKGKFVAIEPESGHYFLGDTCYDAYSEAIKKHPDMLFVFKRVGFRAAYYVGRC